MKTNVLRRSLVIAGLALSLATCRDAFEPGATASIAVAPIFPAAADLAAFGLTIDGVRFIVVRPAADTLADTTVALSPGVTELAIDIRVPVLSSHDSVSITVMALGSGGTLPLFAGTRMVPVPTPLPPPVIPLDTYLGPAVDSIAIQPRVPFILLNDSLRFQVAGFNAGAPVSQLYVAWSTSDSGVARINPLGVLRAPGARSSVLVRARTPSGASDSVTATFTPAASQLVAIAGGGQSGLVGALLPVPLEIETRAPDGLGVGGVPVRFRRLLGGGLVADTLVVTDAGGRARTIATLGSVFGTNTFEAAVSGLAGSPITFSAIALSAPATRLLSVAGDVQTATVGTAVPIRPAVRVEDSFGNPVAGVSVTFAASAGSVVGASQLTNANGVATVGGWTVGTAVGPNTLTATVAGLTPVAFTATGLAGAATTLVKVAADSQSALVNTAVPIPPRVRIEDQFGNPVPGVNVAVAVAAGSGLVAISVPVTDTTGAATVGSWQLGTLAGHNALTMSVSGLAGSPVTFAATGLRDVAAQLVRVSVDTQTAIAGQPVSVLPVVRVADQYGNAVPGHSITFALTGALVGSLTPSVATTDTGGVARVTDWTLAITPGLNTLEADASGLLGSPITFNANGITTTASTMVAAAGNAQSGVVATLLSIAYSVEVRDGSGALLPNEQVHWAVGTGGGSMNPPTSVTDASGIASSTRTLGPLAGTQTATASIGALSAGFSATALPDVPARMLKLSADAQAATVGTLVGAPPAVRVVDQFDNPVPGAEVIFAVIAGGGTVTGGIDTTDASGAVAAGGWTLGTIAGSNTMRATVTGVPPVMFSASGVPGAPAQLAFVVAPAHAFAGNTVGPAIEVVLRDQFGNLASTATDNVTLDLGPAPPDTAAKLIGSVDVAAVNGVAVFSNVAIDSAGSGFKLMATSGTLPAVVSAAFDVGGVIGAVVSDGLDPVAAAFSPATSLVCVPGATRFLGVLDPSKLEITPYPILQSDPFDAVVNPVTNRLYVSTLAGVAVVIDCQKPPELRPPVVLGGEARGIAVDAAANRVYIAAADLTKGTGSLVPIDGSLDLVVTGDVVELPAFPIGTAFNPVDGFVYVAMPALRSLAVIDPKPGGARIVGELLVLGEGTHGVAVDPQRNLVFATNRDESTVSVIDAATREERARLPVGRFPEALAVDRGVVYVANVGDGTLSLIDVDKLAVVATLVVGPQPKGVAVDPGSGRLYVPTFADDQVRVVQP